MTQGDPESMSLWRRLFFRSVCSLESPDPLAVDWPAGDVVIRIQTFTALTFWCHDTVIGMAEPATVELRGSFPTPPRAFYWDAPGVGCLITSVEIDGVEQLAQSDPIDAPVDSHKFGISSALFARQPVTREFRRRWWAWIPRLWEREDGYP